MSTLEILPATIRARTERQAMEWSLVLASQEIGVTLDRNPEDGGWRLIVDSSDEARAREVLRQFRRENRRFGFTHEVPGSDFGFDSRALLWAVSLALIFMITGGPAESTLFDTVRVRQGEWWRAFTAVGLHQDLPHLASNLTIGILFLGLAMARFGAATAFLGSLLAGALANGAGLVLRGEDYRGLGSSGMVMGALGMLMAQSMPQWRSGRRGNRIVLSSLGTGALIFILVGTNPSSDILAHAAGLVFGLLMGSLSLVLPGNKSQSLPMVPHR